MAFRSSAEEVVIVAGNRSQWMEICEIALEAGEFGGVEVNPSLFQLEGTYHKWFTWGEIIVTLIPDPEGTRITMRATAGIDNIYALFKSPTKTILKQFKLHLKPPRKALA